MVNVFVGFLYDDEKADELLRITKCGLSAATNQYQKGFLSGLPGETRIISTISMGMFPRRSRKLFFKREQKRYENSPITYLPFVNFYFIKDVMFQIGLKRELSKILAAQEQATVYIYNLNVVFEKVMAAMKRKYGERIHFCLIIPDLPGKYGIVRKGLLGIKDRMEVKPKMELAKWADSYVFLTEAMKELFPPKPYKVIEGFLPEETFDYTLPRVPKSVLYTGSLESAFGIETLLRAFSMLPDPDAQLWICGSGGIQERVKKLAQEDPRIQYKGFLPKKQVAVLQSQCDVLVNPRTGEGEYTKYSFPSKTMEYLLSGSKVVMYRLPGIGEEYYRYIHVVDQPGEEAMAHALREAWTDVDFYNSRSQEQVEWIRENKSAKKQVARLVEERYRSI